jgi:hypothetical protein
MSNVKRYTDIELEQLEFEIQESIEYLQTTLDDEVECISIENLETILTKFFHRTISLTLY